LKRRERNKQIISQKMDELELQNRSNESILIDQTACLLKSKTRAHLPGVSDLESSKPKDYSMLQLKVEINKPDGEPPGSGRYANKQDSDLDRDSDYYMEEVEEEVEMEMSEQFSRSSF
jgi:hypothetical protein